MTIATLCYVLWGLKTILKCTMCPNKPRTSNKCLTHMDKQRVGGGGRRQGWSLLGDPVATRPDSLFYFCAPAELAVETYEPLGQLHIVLWLLVWDTTILECSVDICLCSQSSLSLSNPVVEVGAKQRPGLSPRMGFVILRFCTWIGEWVRQENRSLDSNRVRRLCFLGDSATYFPCIVNITAELSDSEGQALAVTCRSPASVLVSPPSKMG